MTTYMVRFDFTTVHGNKFVGRNGQVVIESKNTIDQIKGDLVSLQKVCADYIYSQKPKWNILMINIKNVTELATN